MEERVGLFREYETGAFSVTELCARHGISREIVRFCGRDLGLINRERRFLRFAPPRARLRLAQKTPLTPEQS